MEKQTSTMENLGQSFFIPDRSSEGAGRKRETSMKSIYNSSEQYTDRGHYAVMTRTTVLKEAQLARVADHLRRNAEELASSSNPPTVSDCRIAGAMVTWAFNIAPLCMDSGSDY